MADYGSWQEWRERCAKLRRQRPRELIGGFMVYCQDHNDTFCSACEPFIDAWVAKHPTQVRALVTQVEAAHVVAKSEAAERRG